MEKTEKDGENMMIKNPNFEIVRLAEECMAVPVGDETTTFHGVVALSEAAAFLLEKMTEPQTTEDLVNKLLEQYDVDLFTAKEDVLSIINTFKELNLVLEC